MQTVGPPRIKSLPPVCWRSALLGHSLNSPSPPSLAGADVAEWMKELNGYYIPDISPTKDGTCAGDPQAAAQAASRGWWTCGGYTRDTDITACPSKMTWGVSFDDGPGFYSQSSSLFYTCTHSLALPSFSPVSEF